MGPLETNTVTGLPASSGTPCEGSVEITLPLATDALERLCTLGLKCACSSLCSACALVRPLTSGTPTLAGPVETTTLTCAPRCTTLPARG